MGELWNVLADCCVVYVVCDVAIVLWRWIRVST